MAVHLESQRSEILATASFFEIAPRIRELLALCSRRNQERSDVDRLLMQLPEVIVAGNQSSGKSTLLNRLINFDILPTGGDMVTTRPTRFSRWNVPVSYGHEMYDRAQVIVKHSDLTRTDRKKCQKEFEEDGERIFRARDGESLEDFLRLLNHKSHSGISNILNHVPQEGELSSDLFEMITVDVKLKTYGRSVEDGEHTLIHFLDIPGLNVGGEQDHQYYYLFLAIFRKAIGWSVQESDSETSQDKYVLLVQKTRDDDTSMPDAEIGDRRLHGVEFFHIYTMCDACDEESPQVVQKLVSPECIADGSDEASNNRHYPRPFLVGYLNTENWRQFQRERPQWLSSVRNIHYGLKAIHDTIFVPVNASMQRFLESMSSYRIRIKQELDAGIKDTFVRRHPMLPFLPTERETTKWGEWKLDCKKVVTEDFFKSTAFVLQCILEGKSQPASLESPFDCYKNCFENLKQVQKQLIQPLACLSDRDYLFRKMTDCVEGFLLFRSSCPKFSIDEGELKCTSEEVNESSLDFLINEAYKEVSEWRLQKSIPISRFVDKFWSARFYLKTREMQDRIDQNQTKVFFQIICDQASPSESPSQPPVNTFKTPIFSLLSSLKHLERSFSEAFDYVSKSYDPKFVGYKQLVDHLKLRTLHELFFRTSENSEGDSNSNSGRDNRRPVGIYYQIFTALKGQITGALWPKECLNNIKLKNPGLQYEDLELYLISQFVQPSTNARLGNIQRDLDTQAGELKRLLDNAVATVKEVDRAMQSPAFESVESFCSGMQLDTVLHTIEPSLLGDDIQDDWFDQSELFAAPVLSAKRQDEIFSVRHIDVPRDSRTVFWKKKTAYSGTHADGILYCLRLVCVSQSTSSKRIVCSYRSLLEIQSFISSLDDPSFRVIFNRIPASDITGGSNWFRSEFIDMAQGVTYDLFAAIMNKVNSVHQLDESAKQVLKRKLSEFLVHNSDDADIASLSESSSPSILKSKKPIESTSCAVFPAFIPGVWLLAHGILSQSIKSHLLLLERVLPVPDSPTFKEFQKIRDAVNDLSIEAAGVTEQGSSRALSSLEAFDNRAKRLRLAQGAIESSSKLSLLRKLCVKGDPVSKRFQESCNKAFRQRHPQSEGLTMSPNHMAQIAMICQLLENQMRKGCKSVVGQVADCASRFKNSLTEAPRLQTECGDAGANAGVFTQIWIPELNQLAQISAAVRDTDVDRQKCLEKITRNTNDRDKVAINDLIDGFIEVKDALTPLNPED